MGKKSFLYQDKVGRPIQKGDLVLVSTVIGLNGEFRVRRGAKKELFIARKRLRDLYPATLQVIEAAQGPRPSE